jgi:hypothetical protein
MATSVIVLPINHMLRSEDVRTLQLKMGYPTLCKSVVGGSCRAASAQAW